VARSIKIEGKREMRIMAKSDVLSKKNTKSNVICFACRRDTYKHAPNCKVVKSKWERFKAWLHDWWYPYSSKKVYGLPRKEWLDWKRID
jgi:hypothetical protein